MDPDRLFLDLLCAEQARNDEVGRGEKTCGGEGEYQSEEDLFRDESRASGAGDADAHSAQNCSSNVFIRTAGDDQLVRVEAGRCAAGFAGATQRARSGSGASEHYSNRPTTFAGLC